ncbi:2-amino-4-hydroxy-6-hydroxymethyldihydropteridine diphosphokinase [Xylanibacillus composti]|uniref:2-amino-4-hydroxy-6-hydroxymethyldihydropteridine diphosphokinase n=1 Tax=Xylanibacillus composti TaxID=1572762 RepID=A0A8J4H0G9_9BACL|nr:2-amino-4-hydroxy-6-hydroxymethyldihydropteridine diphosphokinase [Xylanibacillus composti]MDT9725106.1 2-amino-4-hydroxy-6-hydroxymethyldihydropteridine diphosphokinase [Xylanibacillus composti]GIQ67321.1 hypothetical protein XYCOK13_01450 [Xylanibacillus composti]
MSFQTASGVYVGLGSNMGDRLGYLKQALADMDAHARCEVVRCSPVYETAPVGYVDQPSFLNMAAMLRTDLPPMDLLHMLMAIERKHGRVRDERWGPRTLDLDILHWSGVTLTTDELTIPHPRMAERPFVLIPLLDIADHDPSLNTWLRKRMETMDDEGGVELWTHMHWPGASVHSAN